MTTLPLHRVRVLDLTDGLAESGGRYLADLGAEVIRVESPNGSASRAAAPVVEGVSIPFALRNVNKLAMTLDLDDAVDRDRFRDLAGDADMVIESQRPGHLTSRGLGAAEIRAAAPQLVWVSVSPFGQDGPYRDWAASEAVLYAMSGVLSRSGAPGAEPLLPPAGLVEETVGAHTAWAALLAYFRRLRTGRGDTVDLSAFEAMVHGFDPGFGTQGSAAAGRSEDYPRNRPNAADFYPVFPCNDGHVRICLLAKRQWRGMFEWLSQPAEFADPVFDTIPARFAAADRLHPLIEDLFAPFTQAELVAEGARRGVPVGGVHTLPEALATEHFNASGAIIEGEIAPGVRTRLPSGLISVDGERAGFRRCAPRVGEHGGAITVRSAAGQAESIPPSDSNAPLAGVRVLDLGVIVFGAELSRQFADYGADVIKIENANFPDGLRQSKRGARLSASVAWGHRNKRSLGVDLRSAEGAGVFRRLVAEADVVLANFKPGTLASMGFSYAELSRINPRIIVSESSAFGHDGPWRTRLGYGPLVRASSGVSALWRYPDNAELLCDGSTVYPDHIAAHIAASGVLAALSDREATGRGAHLTTAQSDTALMQIGVQLVAEALAPGSITAAGNADPYCAPAGVFPCAGDDEWCVVTIRDDTDWARFCDAIGRRDLVDDPRFTATAGRIAYRDAVDAVVTQWTDTRSPADAARELQAAGVPAGPMLRLPELLTNPQLEQRRSYTSVAHDLLNDPLPATARAARFDEIPDPSARQAPLPGEQTREICVEVLDMAADEIDRLVRTQVLQPPADDPALLTPA
ncbi:CoA transferase [Streptomyces sp. SID6673]|nr:CoA transferase [Streptomyces sp. SID11726]NEB23955.1 CoA transferase [Streptomyces sp. SID6673]